VTPARRDAIHAKLKRNRATALFVYAPGYLGPDGQSLGTMEALTGIKIAKDDRQGRPQVRLEAGDLLSNGLETGRTIGVERLTVAPLFYADDPQAHVAGRLIETERPGLVVKPIDGWTCVYSAAIQLPSGLMRNLARMAGVHIWLETDDALYADGRYVGLHAASNGTKTIYLPGRFRVWDAVCGKPVTSDGQKVVLPTKQAQTVLLRLEEPD